MFFITSLGLGLIEAAAEVLVGQGLNHLDFHIVVIRKKAGTGEEAKVNVEIEEDPTLVAEAEKVKQSLSRETLLRSQVREIVVLVVKD